MTATFVHRFNDAIHDFVSMPENARLRRGTGGYSAPFRGTLFGKANAVEVDATLQRAPVDVLWMGSNPNVPQSLEAILGDGDGCHYESFARQCACGMFSEQSFHADGMSKGWNPIHDLPHRGWQFYSRLLASTGDVHRVATANFVVWGSRTFGDWLSRLEAFDRPLLRRALDFSVGLNRDIVKSLCPAIVVVPFSLGANRPLQQLVPMDLAINGTCRRYDVETGKRRFRFFIQEDCAALQGATILHVPHSSSLRLNAESEARVLWALQKALDTSRRPLRA